MKPELRKGRTQSPRHPGLSKVSQAERRMSVYLESAVFDDDLVTGNVSHIKLQILSKLDDFQKLDFEFKERQFTCIVVSNNEQFIAISSKRYIHLFDITTKKIFHTFEDAHSDFISSLAMTNNNTLLVSSSYDREIKVWDLKERKFLSSFSDLHNQKISAVTFTGDGNSIISGSEFHISIWDLEKQEGPRCIENAHEEEITSLKYLEKENRILSVSRDRALKIWNFKTLELVYSFDQAHTSEILNLAVTSDERLAITTSKGGSISVWDLNLYDHVCALGNIHKDAVQAIGISNDNKFAICASWDKSLSIWDLGAKTLLYTLENLMDERIVGLATTKDDRYVICIGQNGRLSILDLLTQKNQYKLQDEESGFIEDMKLTSDDKFVVSTGSNCLISVWDFKTKTLVHSFSKPGNKEFHTIDITPDNTIIASGCTDKNIDLWSLSERNHICTLPKSHRGMLTCVSFNKDGTKLASSCTMETICIWDVSQRILLHRMEDTHENWVTSVIWTSDSKSLISSSFDKSIKIWDVEKAACVHTFINAHKDQIQTIRLTADDKILISSSDDRTIKLWDIQTKHLVHTFSNSHKGKVYGLAVSKDNRFLLSGDSEHSFAIHSLKTKQHMFSFISSCKFTKYVAITSNLKWFVYSADKSIEVLENPFYGLTIINGPDFSPFSPFQFMPLSSFFTNESLEHRKNLIKCYPNLRIFPYAWSWFHIAAIYTPQKELIETCLEMQIPFEIDLFGKTPLHYLVNNEITDLISITKIIGRLSLIISNHPQPYELLDSMSDILYKLIGLQSYQIIMFLQRCDVEPQMIGSQDLEFFGELPDNKTICYHLSDSKVYSEEIRKSFKIQKGRKKIRVRLLPFQWEYSKSSLDMYQLTSIMTKMKNQEFFQTKTVSILIDYLWMSTKNYHYFIGTLFTIFTILLSIYTAIDETNFPMEVGLFIFSLFFFFYELFEICSVRIADYLSTFWNWVDMFGMLVLPGTIIGVWVDLPEDMKTWMFSLSITYVYTRLISYCRVFKQSRNFIRMVIEIIKDIRTFAVAMILITLGLALISLQFDRETSFGRHLLNAYTLLFYNYDTSDYSTGQMFYFVIVTILVIIVLGNMLFAIMWDTYSRVQGQGVLTDSHELLELIDENMALMRSIKFFKDGCRRRRRGIEHHSRGTYKRFEEKDLSEGVQGSAHIPGKKQYLFFAEEVNEYELPQEEKVAELIEAKKNSNFQQERESQVAERHVQEEERNDQIENKLKCFGKALGRLEDMDGKDLIVKQCLEEVQEKIHSLQQNMEKKEKTTEMKLEEILSQLKRLTTEKS